MKTADEARRRIAKTRPADQIAVFIECHRVANELVEFATGIRGLARAIAALPAAQEDVVRLRSRFPGIEFPQPFVPGAEDHRDGVPIDGFLWMKASMAPVAHWSMRILDAGNADQLGQRQLVTALAEDVLRLSLSSRQSPNLSKASARICALAAALLGWEPPTQTEHALLAVLAQAPDQPASAAPAVFKTRVDSWRKRLPKHHEIEDSLQPEQVVQVFDGVELRPASKKEMKDLSPPAAKIFRPKKKQRAQPSSQRRARRHSRK